MNMQVAELNLNRSQHQTFEEIIKTYNNIKDTMELIVGVVEELIVKEDFTVRTDTHVSSVMQYLRQNYAEEERVYTLFWEFDVKIHFYKKFSTLLSISEGQVHVELDIKDIPHLNPYKDHSKLHDYMLTINTLYTNLVIRFDNLKDGVSNGY